ncbi:hypothetical protein [Sinorhizobium meliloti]|uniref:Transposase n=1 Tax=Rhizobium meliloti TaxID=382 RepID=A0AAW9TKE0_RHIML|nr:hypothetical protein [Sinorhizobium meliloti]MQW31859.1 hypothetical protein [Sinorhizobium meliloti]
MIADRDNRMMSARAFWLFRQKRELLPLPENTLSLEAARYGRSERTMAPKFGKDEDLHAYREVLLIRRFERRPANSIA